MIVSSPAAADDQKVCFSNGPADSIIAACTRAIDTGAVRGRNKAIAYNQRGLARESAGDSSAAISDFSEAIQLDPKYAIALNNRSWLYNNKGEYDHAIADSSEAIRLDRKYATAYVNRGVSYENKGEYDKAIADYTEAIKLNPKFAAAYNNRGVCFSAKGEFDRAIRDFDRAVQLRPKEVSTYYNRATTYERKGDLDRALANYRVVLQLKPNDQDAATAIRHVERSIADRRGSDLAIVTPSKQVAPKPVVQAAAPAIAPTTIGRRVALVVGNSNYRFANKLVNPINDAADIAQALRKLNFEVIEGRDLEKRKMEDLLREFGRKLEGAELGLFFYAGHGMQVSGKNYILPVDTRLERAGDLSLDTIDLSLVLAQMEVDKRINLIFLDACRDNPLAGSFARTLGTRSASIGRGLARVHSSVGTMIAYATQPDNVALDGEGRNSPFTASLVRHISTAGLDIGAVMRRVRADVVRATKQRQVPWEYSSLVDEVILAR